MDQEFQGVEKLYSNYDFINNLTESFFHKHP